jgi:hypothetical protein
MPSRQGGIDTARKRSARSSGAGNAVIATVVFRHHRAASLHVPQLRATMWLREGLASSDSVSGYPTMSAAVPTHHSALYTPDPQRPAGAPSGRTTQKSRSLSGPASPRASEPNSYPASGVAGQCGNIGWFSGTALAKCAKAVRNRSARRSERCRYRTEDSESTTRMRSNACKDAAVSGASVYRDTMATICDAEMCLPPRRP